MKKILLVLIVILISYFSYSYYNFTNNKLIFKDTIIDIKSGDNIKTLSKKLKINYYFLKNHIKHNKTEFKLLA
jgi:hypothetical protein